MFDDSQTSGECTEDTCTAKASAGTTVASHVRRVEGSLASYVRALVALEMRNLPRQTRRLLPRASFILCGALAAGDDALAGIRAGTATRYSGATERANTMHAGGSGFSYYAVLTPLGVVTLFGGRRVDGLPSCAPAANNILEARDIKYLEQSMACAPTGAERLCRFGNWLEQRMVVRRRVTAAASRAARVAARLHNAHGVSIEALAAGEGLSRRQLERDFRRHLDISPSRYAAGIRLQAALRMAIQGERPASIAAELGFADQAHLGRAIKLYTGHTPRTIVAAARDPLARLFLDLSDELLSVQDDGSRRPQSELGLGLGVWPTGGQRP